MKCRIKWIDVKTGKPTPDNHDAVGYVILHSLQADGSKRVHEPIPICAEHLKQMPQGKMYTRQGEYTGYWEFRKRFLKGYPAHANAKRKGHGNMPAPSASRGDRRRGKRRGAKRNAHTGRFTRGR